MGAGKKIAFGFSILISALLVWYLFVKETDYCITFKVKTASGTVFQGVQEWSAIQGQYTILEKRNFDFIKQEIKNGDTQMEYTWDIQSINDSVTKVSVGIKDVNHSLYNKITVPFCKTSFKEEQIKKMTDFKDGLNNHLKNFKVKIEGEGESEETFVAYINLKSVLHEKAKMMIGSNVQITGFLQENNIKITGRPYVEVEHWDQDKGTLDFNYCFPIDKNAMQPYNELVKFKRIPVVKGLKATYYGNFATSDRAWFSLLDYAKKHHYKLKEKPLEHFLSNPFDGGNELDWEAKIIIPFEDK